MNTLHSGKRVFSPQEIRRILELRELYRASGGIAGCSLAQSAKRAGCNKATLRERIKESGVKV